MSDATISYDEAQKAVATYIARQQGCTHPSVRHFNKAAKILWPALDQEEQSKLILR